MLFGIDTSGKIGEGNLYIAIVAHEKDDLMSALRERLNKRHGGLASRRRIKASTLNDSELDFVAKNVRHGYDGALLSISDFAEVKKKTSNISNWKIKTLAAAIYLCSRRIVKMSDVVLVDRDYSEDVMKNIFSYLKVLFKRDGKDVVFESGTSFNEVIGKADLIAGCLRRGRINPRKIEVKELIRYMKEI